MPWHVLSHKARKSFVLSLCASALAMVACVATGGTAIAGATVTTMSGPAGNTRYGETAEFSAMVAGGGPGGTVTFLDGAKSLGTGNLETLGARTSIDADGFYACAVTGAGGVQCWGNNGAGQLGDNSTTNRYTPVPVEGLSSGVAAVSTGYDHACALTEAGAVWCWGFNSEGQLGNGTTVNSLVPTPVSGLSSGVKSIAAGTTHNCAITQAGGLKCWGYNGYGQLGDGTSGSFETEPVQVDGLLSGVMAVSVGQFHTCAITDAGAAKCWGRNTDGQLGNGNSPSVSTTPSSVVGLSSGATAITSGRYHSCALIGTGSVKCWGDNSEGQLGDGTTDDSDTPVIVSGLPAGLTDIDAGWNQSCALTAAGAPKCWGDNGTGQLGTGATSANSLSPVGVVGLTSGVVGLSMGAYSACALTGDGAVKCWGQNTSGQLGDNSTTDSTTPVDVDSFGPGAALVRAETTFSTGALQAGARSVKARYDGDANNAASTSAAVTHTVDKGKTKVKKIKLTPKKPKTGKSVRIKVEMEAKAPAVGTPEGKVVIKDGKKKLGKFKVNKKGKASIKVKSLSAGSHTIKAKYQGDKNWKKSDDNKKVTVK